MIFFNSYNDNYNIEKHLKEENKIYIGSIEFSLNKSNIIIKEVIKDYNPFLLKL